MPDVLASLPTVFHPGSHFGILKDERLHAVSFLILP